MSLPFSVGDLFAAGQMAYQVYKACGDAGDEYRNLGQLCHNVHLVINRCDSTRALLHQGAATIDLFASDIKSTIAMVDQLLVTYKGMERTSFTNFGRRIKFSLVTSSDRGAIEKKLEAQLRTLNAFLAGSILDYQTLTVRLLVSMVKEKQRVAGVTSVETNNIKALIEELGCEGQETRDKLLADEEGIQQKVIEESANIGSAIETATEDTAVTEKSVASVLEESTKLINAPARTKVDKYDADSFPWFRRMRRVFIPLTVDQALVNDPHLPEPFIRYSEVDEWLCPFQEGWTLNRTAAQRLNETEDAYYFSFNGLSSEYQDPPKTSRLYFRRSSLIPDIPEELKIKWGEALAIKRGPGGSIKFNPIWSQGFEISEKLTRFRSSKSGGYAGFARPFGTPWPSDQAQYSSLWPFDPSDEVTQLFICAHFDNNGLCVPYAAERIDDSLPHNWMWKRDNTGQGHHVYIYLGANPPKESTVHPGRFYIDSKDMDLPAGWDRRLDYDGNVFFVDHNTQTATRVDPRSNRNVDQETGLPKGWRRITDNNSKAWYFTEIGGKIIATTYPSRMNSKSLDWKIFLTRAPQNNCSVAPLFEENQEDNHYYHSESKDIELPAITDTEKQRYYDVFRRAKKQNKYRITWSEAVAHCENLSLPPSLYVPILTKADANKDQIFTPSEYAAALHRIRFTLEDSYTSQIISPPTDEEVQGYEAVFERHTSTDALEIPLQDAIKLSRGEGFGLAEEVIKGIWETYDTNRDGMLDIVEFCEAYYRFMTEMQRRRELCEVGGEPLLPGKLAYPDMEAPKQPNVTEEPDISTTSCEAEASGANGGVVEEGT